MIPVKHDYSNVKFITVDGTKWYFFSVLYETDEGLFTFGILATSWEHAAAMISDIKQTAYLYGAICC